MLVFGLFILIQSIDALRKSNFQMNDGVPVIAVGDHYLKYSNRIDDSADVIDFKVSNNNRNLDKSFNECQICTKAIWEVSSCRLGSIKVSDMFGTFMIYGENKPCYENKCCADNLHDCCATREQVIVDWKNEQQTNSSSNSTYILIGCIVGGCLLGLFIAITLYLYQRRLQATTNVSNNVSCPEEYCYDDEETIIADDADGADYADQAELNVNVQKN